MVHEACVCGNVLRQGGDDALKIRRSPCRCAKPARGPRTLRQRAFSLEHVSRRQYAERTRLGLPLLSPLEQAVLRKEV